MTTRAMAGRSLARLAVFALGALAGIARGQAQHAPLGVPAHAMLEDPFNRSLLVDELETHEQHGGRELGWDATFWAGRAFDKLLLRTEGEKRGGSTDRAELELLWSHAVGRWWDVVAGTRADFAPGDSDAWAAFGVRGIALYRFGIEATAYGGDGGTAAARFVGEYELLITQRLILAPELELDWFGRADPARGRGAGLATTEAALRLRYEVKREVAPYVGLVRERKHGGTAELARAAGEDPEDTRLVAGVRLRF
jgi:copper resistance protein B